MAQVAYINDLGLDKDCDSSRYLFIQGWDTFETLCQRLRSKGAITLHVGMESLMEVYKIGDKLKVGQNNCSDWSMKVKLLSR